MKKPAWDKLPVAAAALRTVVEQFGARSPRHGVAVLLASDPATSMRTAEVAAGALGKPLHRVALSAIVSKYIGETEKNIGRAFDDAARADVVLLLEEAEALFGKRSDVKDSHDRYANVEVAYLLQRIEAFDGLVILTTNRKAAIDPAFLRRLRMAIDLPGPPRPPRTAG